MSKAWRTYCLTHVCLLLLVAVFAVYARIMQALPDDVLHCLLHDLLHLYCPFCGGTRGALALLELQIADAVRLCGDLIVAMLIGLVLDLRALVLLLRGRTQNLIPLCLPKLATAYFACTFVLRNTLLLGGYDAIGDLLPFWQERASLLLAGGFCLLSLGALFLLGVALELFPRMGITCAVAAFGAATCVTLLAAWLYSLWILLALPLLIGGTILFCKKKSRG